MSLANSLSFLSFAETIIEKLKKKIDETKPEISKEDRAREEKLLSTLKEMQTQYYNNSGIIKPDYDEIYPTSLGLEKQNFETKNEQELLSDAERELLPQYNKKVNKKIADTEYNVEKLNVKTDEIKDDMAEVLDSVENGYYNKLDDFTNGLIKKGMLLSSVKGEGEKEIEENTLEKLNEVSREFSEKLNVIEKEIEHLNTEKENALNDYEIGYAVDLEKKVSALKREMEQELNKVNAYNTKIANREINYQAQRQKLIQAAEYDRLLKQEKLEAVARSLGESFGYSDELNTEYYKRYTAALNFYSSLPEDIAKPMAKNNSALKDYMGKYYDLLLTKI